jgi:hypothetical protein
MLHFFASNHTHHSAKKCSRKNRGLQFENLEGRALMSATPLAASIPVPHTRSAVAAAVAPAIPISANELHGLTSQEAAQLKSLAALGSVAAASSYTPPKATVTANGTLIIHGCKGTDNVNVAFENNCVELTHTTANYHVIEDGRKFTGVKQIIFLGYDGDNTFSNHTNLPSQAIGGAGVDNFFSSSSAKDTFFGLGGDDYLYGYSVSGSDYLFGGTGNDRLEDRNGATSVNVLKGGKGNDSLVGGGGKNYMYGDDGNDTLSKGLFSNTGVGYLYGGAGNDILSGQDYPDYPNSRNIKLEMHGGTGNDKLIVTAGVMPARRWAGDDYYNDQAF